MLRHQIWLLGSALNGAAMAREALGHSRRLERALKEADLKDARAYYEAQRALHVAYFQKMMPHYVARLSWPREKVIAEQTRSLRALLAHAARHSPWHARRLRGIDLERIDAQTIDLLPTMTKADLMANWDEIVTDRSLNLEKAAAHLKSIEDDAYLPGGHHIVASGGSSGQTGQYAYDWHAWAMNLIAPLRGLFALAIHLKMSPSGTGAVIYAHEPSHSSFSLARTFSNSSQDVHRFPVTLSKAEIVAGINRVKPDVVSCYSSYLPVLTEAQRKGELSIRPKLIWTSAEPMTAKIRDEAEEAFGCTVVNSWGASETMGSMPAAGERGIYMSDDMNVFEYLDAKGTPIRPGETSHSIRITNCYNRLMPLIRYELSDQFVLSEKPSRHGLGFTHVKEVMGRNDDVFLYDGKPAHPVMFWSPLDRVPQVVEFQIRQTTNGADIDLVVSAPIDEARVAHEMKEALTSIGLESPDVSVQVVDEIPRLKLGKLKRFVPLKR